MYQIKMHKEICIKVKNAENLKENFNLERFQKHEKVEEQ